MTITTTRSRRPGAFRLLVSFASDRGGATAIEYALIAAGIFLAIAAVVPQVGVAVNGLFEKVNGSL